MLEDRKIFYRYTITNFCNDGDAEFSQVKVFLNEFYLKKETAKGYWISDYPSRWVSKTSRKRFAYPSKEEAQINLIMRTKRRIRILTHQLEVAKQGLTLIRELCPKVR
jgi:hypothetical protein